MICSFCGEELPPGTGIIYVHGDKMRVYCSSKCKKNAEKLKRKPKKATWVTKTKKKTTPKTV